MQETIELYNNFHRTKVRIRLKGWRLSKQQIRRAKKVLCGIDGCVCGGLAGERGPQIQGETSEIFILESRMEPGAVGVIKMTQLRGPSHG